MNTLDSIIDILKREGVEFLSCYPTTPLIEAAAKADLRPVICRQERVGIGIADGYTRTHNGKKIGVFGLQYGPGIENALAGVATAYSDATPMLILPMGHPTGWAGIEPYFSAQSVYAPVTKWIAQFNQAKRVPELMRRAFSLLKMGKGGPVMLEIPSDIANEEVGQFTYEPVKATRPAGNPEDIAEAARLLLAAKNPVIYVGQGALYAEATKELIELAELLQAPVTTTLAGKSAFPENHPLSLGTASIIRPKTVPVFLAKADVVLGVGCSLARHYMQFRIPAGKTIIQITNEDRDINKDTPVGYPIIGDAKLVLVELIELVKKKLGKDGRKGESAVAREIKKVKDEWLAEWMPKLTSEEVPLNPYRIIWELIHTIDPRDAIVTHDAGGPRNQILPFYPAIEPRSYIGWGKSHQLGTGLGLIMGAKLAKPEKVCINLMGDAAIGMVGMDFETASRHKIPIITMVTNNSIMAVEKDYMPISHQKYGSRFITGDYAKLGEALGGYAERIENPKDIAPALRRARRVTEEEKKPVLLEFITNEESTYSRPT